jgi:hypothetical protein
MSGLTVIGLGMIVVGWLGVLWLGVGVNSQRMLANVWLSGVMAASLRAARKMAGNVSICRHTLPAKRSRPRPWKGACRHPRVSLASAWPARCQRCPALASASGLRLRLTLGVQARCPVDKPLLKVADSLCAAASPSSANQSKAFEPAEVAT